MNNMKAVVRSFVEGIDLYKSIKYRGEKVIPLSIMFVLFLFYTFLGEKISEILILTLKNQIEIGVFTDKFIYILSKTFVFVIYFYTYKFIVLGILSPFLNSFSEKVEDFYQGKIYEFSFIQNVRFFFRGIGLALGNFLIEMIFTMFFFFLGIFLPFKFIFYSLTILIQAFFIAYSFVDYSFERREYNIKHSLKEAFREFIPLSLMGLCFLVFFSIPIVGVLYGPFYFTGVITLYILKKEKIS